MNTDIPPQQNATDAQVEEELVATLLDERRNTTRLRVSLPVRWEGNSCVLRGEIVDLSSTGCFILTDDKVEEGELIRVEITLPTREPISIWGEVVYRMTEIGFGLRLTGSSDDDFKLFKWLVGERAARGI
ncbi:MAG: PilZ domain-containing protein [Pyrinomonadaceae bacterium]